MKTLIIIFIVVAVIVGLFGVGFVCYDAAAEKRRAKKRRKRRKTARSAARTRRSLHTRCGSARTCTRCGV